MKKSLIEYKKRMAESKHVEYIEKLILSYLNLDEKYTCNIFITLAFGTVVCVRNGIHLPKIISNSVKLYNGLGIFHSLPFAYIGMKGAQYITLKWNNLLIFITNVHLNSGDISLRF